MNGRYAIAVADDFVARVRTEVCTTLRWRKKDSNFQYASAVYLVVAPTGKSGLELRRKRADKRRVYGRSAA